jgi:hypothetical protein
MTQVQKEKPYPMTSYKWFIISILFISALLLGLGLVFNPFSVHTLPQGLVPDSLSPLAHEGRDTLLPEEDVYADEDEDGETDITDKSRKLPQSYFILPVSYDVFLSGTFGELRSNHFHSGIDIRTGGVEGKHVVASAAGYVSRINVSTKGYGNALYITHPNGYTTVYAHLQSFQSNIAFYVKKHQYAQKSFQVELYPPKDLIVVKQGDTIALSGNSGSSVGPHIHYEIRKTSSQEPLNPLLFGLNIQDKLSPEILNLNVYSIDEEYRKKHGSFPYAGYNTTKQQLSSRNITVKIPKGTYAVGAHLRDYFRSHSENLGVNYARLQLNNQNIFEFAIEKVNFSTTRFINAHMDYCIHKTANEKTHRFFKDDGNLLDYYSYNQKKGLFTLNEKDTLKGYMLSTDLNGRKDSLTLTFIEDSRVSFHNKAPSSPPGGVCSLFSPGKNLEIKTANAYVSMPGQALYFNYNVCIDEGTQPPNGAVSPYFTWGQPHVPVHVGCLLGIKVQKVPEEINKNKLLLIEWYKGQKFSAGGTYKNGFVEATVRDMGTYYVGWDTTPPVIVPLAFNHQQSSFVFRIKDNLSGIHSYNAYVDDQWVLMEYVPQTGELKGKWESESKGKHKFKLIVEDERKNKTVFEKTFER